MNNTEKNTRPALRAAPLFRCLPLRLLGAPDSTRTPAAHPGPVSSRNLVSSCGGALPTPARSLLPPLRLSLPRASTAPALCPQPGRGQAGAWERSTSDSFARGGTSHPHPKAAQEAVVVASRAPGRVFSGASLLLCVPVGRKGGLATTPRPGQLPTCLWWGPIAPSVAPQRNDPQHRSRDGRDTREWTWQDRG